MPGRESSASGVAPGGEPTLPSAGRSALEARGFGRRTLPRVVPEPRTKHGALSALTARRMAPPVPKRARMSDDDE